MPQVSIILPTYNRAEFLSRSVDSALDQTFNDFELIVVDDGSTDDTRTVVDGYADGRITYLRHEANRGPSSARNTGLKASDGDLIAFLDSDDAFAPTFLETSVRTLERQPADCGGSCVSYMDCDTRRDEGPELNPVPSTITEIENLREKVTRVGGLLLRSTVVSEIGRFDTSIPYNEDVDYWIRLLQNGYYLAGIEEPLYRYYKHGDQQTKSDEKKARGIKNTLEKHGGALSDRYRMERRRELGMMYAEKGEFREATTEFRRAIEHDPRQASNYWYYLTAKLYPSLFYPPPAVERVYRYVSCR